MAFAIELYFDSVAESKIRAVWSELAAAELPAWPLRIGARPHVSILVLDSGSPAAVEELFRSLTFAPFPVTFSVADYFDGATAIIFLKPSVSEPLRRLHDVAVKQAQERRLKPRHFGDEWIPHCTCDSSVDTNQMAAGLAILRRSIPLEARVEEVGCVEVTPNSVRQIFRQRFAD